VSVDALCIEDPLYEPNNGEVRRGVRTLLDRGARVVVVDLSRVTRIDAAGVGELVRAYCTTIAANAGLRIVHVTSRVRQMLERAGLFDLLSGTI
jgi:anti-anti-sigma factor